MTRQEITSSDLPSTAPNGYHHDLDIHVASTVKFSPNLIVPGAEDMDVEPGDRCAFLRISETQWMLLFAVRHSKRDVYESTPDARQLSTPEIPDDCKLFRKRYRQLEPHELALHDAIKDKASELAFLIGQVKPNTTLAPPHPPTSTPAPADAAAYRIKSMADNDAANVVLALRHLEDCVYRAVKALTA